MARSPLIPRFAVHASVLSSEPTPASAHQGHLPEEEPIDVAALGDADVGIGAEAVGALAARVGASDKETDATSVICDTSEVLCSVFASEQAAPSGHDATREVTLVDWHHVAPNAATSQR